MFNTLIKFSLLCSFPLYAMPRGIDMVFEEVLDGSAIVGKKQIQIPHYPAAYNPSIIPYEEGYLLSFRVIQKHPEETENEFRRDASFVGLVKLDAEFNVKKKSVQLLNIPVLNAWSLGAEDARLFRLGNRIFIFFNDLPILFKGGNYIMYMAELIETEDLFVLKDSAQPLSYEFLGENEKNWSPFVANNRLFAIYSDDPRVILEVDVETGECQECSKTTVNWNWDFGQIRGGTPALFVDGSFLTFFHSSFPAWPTKEKAYVMGAYRFDPTPPFKVQTMTPLPLGEMEDYLKNNSSKIVFPGGMVVEKSRIHVVWGKNDGEILMTSFDKNKLLKSMVPVPE